MLPSFNTGISLVKMQKLHENYIVVVLRASSDLHLLTKLLNLTVQLIYAASERRNF